MPRALLLATAAPAELKAVARGLGVVIPPEELAGAAPLRSWLLEVGGVPLQLALCGVGPVNAALAAGALIPRPGTALPTPSGVVLVGVGGAFDLTATPLGGVVCARETAFPEYGLRWDPTTRLRHRADDDGVDPHGLPFHHGDVDADGQTTVVWDRLPIAASAWNELAALGVRPPSGREAVFITVAGCSATPRRAASLRTRYAGDAPLVEDMETFPFALAAARAGVPFGAVRCVSNLVGSRPPAQWDLEGALAAVQETVAAMLA